MFLLIWFKAGIQTSPPIVPLNRETQAQPLGKLLLCPEVEWDMGLICGFGAHFSSVQHPLFYKKDKIWRKSELKLGRFLFCLFILILEIKPRA